MNKGTFYEEKAIEFLKLKGYKILEKNFKTRWGEIDIIAKDKNYIAFVEVKARKKDYIVSGLEAVNKDKKDKIRKVASFYASKNLDKFYRFDVLEIIQYRDCLTYNLIKGAFNFND
ncbi:MAG: YraN family protein [Candidatus Omnitrophica bacterium]|nr:YraN family protein [Candidatus Omnitrophota bacterium]MCM8831339.1 YraN family protein [Candidatus Omnitrophota bacterium]